MAMGHVHSLVSNEEAKYLHCSIPLNHILIVTYYLVRVNKPNPLPVLGQTGLIPTTIIAIVLSLNILIRTRTPKVLL